MATTAEPLRSDALGSVTDGRAVCAGSRPGTIVTPGWPGEKPSLRFHSVGSMGLPSTLRGIESGLRSRRRPVLAVGSVRVK
jgi:hypothetical protein